MPKNPLFRKVWLSSPLKRLLQVICKPVRMLYATRRYEAW